MEVLLCNIRTIIRTSFGRNGASTSPCHSASWPSAWRGVHLISGAVREKQALEEPAAPITVEVPAASLPDDPEGPEAQIAEPAAAEVPEVIPEQAILPVSGIVVQDYAMDHLCYNATTDDWRVHNGVDLAAPLGEDVQAAKSGKVKAVYEDE